MSRESLTRAQWFETDEHVEIGELHLVTQPERVKGFGAPGESPADAARMVTLMHDLLLGFHASRDNAESAGLRSFREC